MKSSKEKVCGCNAKKIMVEIDSLTKVTQYEKMQLKKEFERNKIERKKIFVTSFSIVVPLIVAALTYSFNAYNNYRQEKANFLLKATEIVMNAESVYLAKEKAFVLNKLFPEYIPDNFVSKIVDT